MDVVYCQLPRFSYEESLKMLEADIEHANALAAAIPCGKRGARLEMKLVYNHFTPLLLFLLQWMDGSCTCLLPRYLNLFKILVYKVYADKTSDGSKRGRKATLSDFYAVILPSLQRLHSDLAELESSKDESICTEIAGKKGLQCFSGFSNVELDREDECGICLEPCTKMVLPNCCHAMCINCYRDWNTRSESCPFCRGSIKRVRSIDLWVLTCTDDMIDTETVLREDLTIFYRYINGLPKDLPDSLFVMHHEYLL